MDFPAPNSSIDGLFLYKLFVFSSIGLVFLLGVVVLLGWFSDVVVLTRVLPGFPAMNPFTAVGFIVSSASFFLYAIQKRNRTLSLIAMALAAVVVVFMSAHLFQLLTLDTSIFDTFLFREKVLSSVHTPARTAISTAVSFLFLAGGLLLIPLAKYFRSTVVPQLFLGGSLFIAGVAFIFYITQRIIFFDVPFFFGMAIHIDVAFLLLSIAMLIFFRYRFRSTLFFTDIKAIVSLVLIFLLVWFGYLGPELKKIPNTFSYAAAVLSTDNLYDSEQQQFKGASYSDTNFSYRVINQVGRVLEIKAVFDVRQPTGEQIFSVERVYAVDQFSGNHVGGFGDKDREGYFFGPKHATKDNFIYWHVNYDQPIEVAFVAEEEILGLKTYKYEATFKADQTTELGELPEVGESKGIALDVYLQIWIEPQTGRLLKYQDAAEGYYYDLKTKQQLEPWNTFSNRYTLPELERQVALAKQEMQIYFFVEYLVPILLVVATLFLIGTYYLLKTSSNRALYFVPYVLLILGTASSFLIWYMVHQNTTADAKAKFDAETQDIIQEITDELDHYDLALHNTRGLLAASEFVGREEWKNYVESLSLQRNFSGVQGVGYAVVLQAAEIADHIVTVRADGFPDYSVYPLEPKRDVYTAIMYLEPFDFRNQRAFGYDMFSQETRQAAMSQARDTGQTAVTGRVTLLQETDEDIQAGFSMYLPYYGKNGLPSTTQQRQDSIAGYVYSPFRAGDLFRSIFVDQKYDIYIEIFDGDNSDFSFEETGLYRASLDNENETDPSQYKPRFTTTKVITVYGRPWTIRFYAEQDYLLTPLQEASAGTALLMSMILTVMLAYLLNVLIYSRSRAVKLADQITQEMKQKTDLLDQANQVLAQEIEDRKKVEIDLIERKDDLERMNKLMVGRELKMLELKEKIKKSK
jgi:CHASE1-domain containing sensor protein